MFNFLPGPGMMGQPFDGSMMVDGTVGPFGLSFPIFLILVLAGFIFWVVMLVDMVQRPVKNKTMWAILFVFTNIVGALVYCFTARTTAEKHGHRQS